MTKSRLRYHILLLAGLIAVPAHAQGPADPTPAMFNLRMPTLGGLQVWNDELVLHDWRIQRNMMTGHCRLIDGDDQRHAWGSFDQCQARLREIAAERGLQPMRGEVVVVLHGLLGSRLTMRKVTEHLREQDGLQVIAVSLSTTIGSVGDHAESLHRVLGHLPEVEKIHFVAHSLGNIVIRHWLADGAENSGGRQDPRVGRIVMLGPPNHGAELAQVLLPPRLGERLAVAGTTRELGMHWRELEPKLATPEAQFGILAGGRGDERGYNPLIPGDDDMMVSVASTQLAGARDFRLLPVMHVTMINDPRVLEYTVRFLKHGHFESEAQRQPIVKNE